MKIYITLFVLLSAFLWSCKESGNNNNVIKCEITSPADGATISREKPLTIKGTGNDSENSISIVKLTVGESVIASVTSVPFEYTVPAQQLDIGSLAISLYVENSSGLSAEHKVTVTVLSEEEGELSLSTRSMDFGYWTEDAELTITTVNNWTLKIPGNATGWLRVYNETLNVWETKNTVTGQGTATVKLQCTANDEFNDKSAALTVSTAESILTVTINQEASPDMLEMLEDQNLKMAAEVSIVIYEVDLNEDGKMSAYEAEYDHNIFGFDAGAWDIKSVRGIEYFPSLKHLDLNTNPELAEIDLSKNSDLRSLHIQNCSSLHSLDVSTTPQLIEIGCDFDLYQTLDLSGLKQNMHTIAAINRTSGPSTLDFSDFPNLSRLYVYDNHLTELNLSGCTNLYMLSAGGNDFTELDLSEVDRDPNNVYIMNNCPNLQTVYVWQGFTIDYYYIFSVDTGVQIIEK